METVNAHQFQFTSMSGDTLDLADYAGRVILVVNTASHCGFTPQYQSLQTLYETYKDQGLVIIGVPCGDFGDQEFADETEVKCFIDNKYTIKFPLTTISHVRGKHAHPFYQWAGKHAGFMGKPKWNFHKYIIDKQGNFVTWFASMTKPMSGKITNVIEQELAR